MGTQFTKNGAASITKFTVEEAKVNPNVIGNSTFNITRPPPLAKCLPACRTQENTNIFSEAQFPPIREFMNQKQFCLTASHLHQVTCASPERKYFLTIHYPDLCEIVDAFGQVFGNESNCHGWPESFFRGGNRPNKTLEDEITNYAKDNLIFVTYFIQSPFLTVIKRDAEMSFTNFVSNTGGLLGLYLGFSFVSLFEIIFWICKCASPSFPKRSQFNIASTKPPSAL